MSDDFECKESLTVLASKVGCFSIGFEISLFLRVMVKQYLYRWGNQKYLIFQADDYPFLIHDQALVPEQ